MPRVRVSSPERDKKKIMRRLKDAQKMRSQFEEQWRINEGLLLNALGKDPYDYKGPITSEILSQVLNTEEGDESADTGVNYIFKHHRFLTAQMSANPPTVQTLPTSSDPSDKRRADTADRLCRHGTRAYQMQEVFDLASGSTIAYGTTFLKTVYDPDAGELVEFDEATGEFKMSGDFVLRNLSIWDVWLDPHARTWRDLKYVFEREWLTEEEAVMRWPEHEELIAQYVQSYESAREQNNDPEEGLEEPRIPVFYYYETGSVVNGFQGQYAVLLEGGEFLESPRTSDHKFSEPPVDREEVRRMVEAEQLGLDYDTGPEQAILPYHILTDIDVPDQVYGKSFIEYAAPAQRTINLIDSIYLDNAEAHGYARMVLPETAEVPADSIKDTPWDIVTIKGGQAPYFVSAPSLMPEMNSLRDRHGQGVDDMAGVNDAMYGKQEREQSGFSMQYATNQGNMIRRRIFNKYVMLVEGVYRQYLAIVQKYWKDDRTIKVMGREKSYQLIDIKGADVLGGFDLVVQYGNSLSLDPVSRREEIMALMPLFEKAGVEPRTLMSMVKLNELEGMHDVVDLANARQQEVFERIIEAGGEIYIPPRKMADHANMLIYCNKFLMTAEFRDLPPKIQILIEKHIEERIMLHAGKEIPSTQGQPPAEQSQPVEMPVPEGGLATPQMSDGPVMPSNPPIG